MCDNNGSFGDDDARAGILKFAINADVLSFTVALTANLCCDRHPAIRNEHAGQLFLFHPSGRRLERKKPIRNIKIFVLSFIILVLVTTVECYEHELNC